MPPNKLYEVTGKIEQVSRLNLLDIILKMFVTYIFLTIILRLAGKKEFSQLNVFDFVVFLVITEIMVMSIESETLSFVHSVVATLSLLFIDRIVTHINMHWKKAKDVFEGRPAYIIFNGKLDKAEMKKLRYSLSDLMHHLRSQSIESISQVAFAILERNGALSVITKEDCISELPDALIDDGNIDYISLYKMGKDQSWLENELLKQGYPNYNDIFCCIPEKDGLFVITK